MPLAGQLDFLSPPSRASRRKWLLAAVVGAASVGCWYVATHDPSDPNSLMPRCPTKAITGLDCPACGGLRMMHALFRGDLAAAAHDNVVLLVCLPGVFVAGLLWVRGIWSGKKVRIPSWAPPPLIIPLLTIVWMVVRNLPAFPLHPLT